MSQTNKREPNPLWLITLAMGVFFLVAALLIATG